MKEPDVLISDIGAFVPFPSALLDEQMPDLKDTEWRLLCVIVRQTLGWQSGQGRKKRDWMSQKQLMARTGRNSAALSAALDALVRKNLIVCQTENQEALVTPQQRRSHRGRVYFSLVQKLLVSQKPKSAKKSESPSKHRKTMPSLERKNFGWAKASDVAQRLAHPLISVDPQTTLEI